ncbi:hypothetical protein Q3G72_023668 [Acer saccharum]|nr:hypothetical protein Q3G72_023668 [Acer saccharum]
MNKGVDDTMQLLKERNDSSSTANKVPRGPFWTTEVEEAESVKSSCTSGKECRDATLTTDVLDTGQAHSKSATAPTNTRVPNDDLVTRSLPHFRSTSRVKDRSQDRISATHQTLKRTQISG